MNKESPIMVHDYAENVNQRDGYNNFAKLVVEFGIFNLIFIPIYLKFIFTNKIINGEPIDVYNNGIMKRDFTFIDDIISGTKAAIENNYNLEIFNLGNNKAVNLLDLINVIEDQLNKKAIINFHPIQLGDIKETYANISKSRNKLNFDPKIEISEGISIFIKWYKEYYK